MNENNFEDNCIFCKVAKGEIPHNRVYENEKFVAFLDIHPVSKGHTLIIPKEHTVWMQDSNDEIISEIFILSKKIMLAMKKSLNCDFVQLVVSGKDVPHFHIHLIPRLLSDKMETYTYGEKYLEGEENEIISKIISKL